MLADVPQEVEQPHGRRPLGVIDQRRRVRTTEVEDPLELAGYALDVVGEFVPGQQVAFLGTTARVAHHPGGTPSQREDAVAGDLHPAKPDLTEEMADVERVCGGVEADVDTHPPVPQPRDERVTVGRIVDESAGVQLTQQIHGE